MAALDCDLRTGIEVGFAALLYHRRRACANPGSGVMMNKQQTIHVGLDHG
jgi:hypothetical protein